MSALSTSLTLWKRSRAGIGLRNRVRCLLAGGMAALGKRRRFLRWLFPRLLSASTFAKVVFVQLKLFGRDVKIELRRGDREDYLVFGELVRGGYQTPSESPDQVIDGGANIGVFSLQACAAFPGAELICFEPDPANATLLESNLDRNEINAQVHRAGLWSRKTTLFFRRPTSYTGHLAEAPPGEPVECVQLPPIRNRCWLKLDIEGAEYEVLPALFERGDFPRWISAEIHFFAERGRQLLKLLRDNGYQISGGDDSTAECCVIQAELVEP